MPISCRLKVERPSEKEFKDLDHLVTGLAFKTQNELGHCCDEEIYQADLALRVLDAGLGPVETELPVTVRFQEFSKTYFLDLVVQQSVVYELKAVSQLLGEHHAQLLHYLMLLELPHGKLLNFQTPLVERRFASTTLTTPERRRFQLWDQDWRNLSPGCERLRQLVPELVADWGAFLEIGLYREALTHFLGGEERVVQRVPFRRDGHPLGNQHCHLIAPDVAFRVTAFKDQLTYAEQDLQRFLAHADLRAIQWINFDRHNIQMKTLRK